MYPYERSLVEKYGNRPFAIVGVNSDEDLDSLRSRIEDERITWPSFWNGPAGTAGPIAARWNVRSWPTTYVLDYKGTIRAKNPSRAELGSLLDRLLAEVP